MNERERILELVKQGVISSEEGLILLENMAGQHDKHASTDASESTQDTQTHDEMTRPVADDTPQQAELAALNSEIAALRGNLDAITAQLKSVSAQVTADSEQIIVLDTLEDLKGLTQDKHEKRGQLKRRIEVLRQQESGLQTQLEQMRVRLAELQAKKAALLKKLDSAETNTSASSLFDDVGNTLSQATRQVGEMVKNSVNTVLENIDWKEVNVRVPGLKSEKFTQSWLFEAADVRTLELKIANGDTTILPWDQDKIGVDATIKLYGKMDEPSAVERFLARSVVGVESERFVLRADNKRVQIDATIHLPRRTYDRINLRVLNGNAQVTGMQATDVIMKSTNGRLTLDQAKGETLEAATVNGDLKVTDAKFETVSLDTVNGDIHFDGAGRELTANTVNGTLRIRLTEGFNSLTASSVHGNLKVALPVTAGLHGSVRTTFGMIKSRLSGLSIDSGSKSIVLDRPGEADGDIKLSTVSGTIQLKDDDLKE